MSDEENPAPAFPPGALDRLTAAEYDELRELTHRLKRRRSARSGGPGTESLVHELYMRLKRAGNESWRDRTHFLAVATLQVRHLLVDHARAEQARKRGGESVRVSLDEESVTAAEPTMDVLVLDEALNSLARREPRQHRVAEFRLFGGLSVEEIGDVLEVSPRTVKEDWRQARAWLAKHL